MKAAGAGGVGAGGVGAGGVGAGGVGAGGVGAGGVDGGGRGNSATAALEEERDFFLRSLRDLESEHAAGDIDEVDYRALKDDYTARAAEVLRRLEGNGEAPALEPPAGEPAGRAGRPGVARGDDAGREGAGRGDAGREGAGREDVERTERGGGGPGAGRAARRRRRSRRWRRWEKGVAAGAALLLAAGAGWQIGKGSSPRLAGQTVTGQALGGPAVAQLLLDGQKSAASDPVAALKDFNQILASYPDQPQALTDEGWILAQGGLVAQGKADLEHAERVAPTYALPHAYLGYIMGDQGDYAGAVAQLRYYLAHGPDPTLASQAKAALAAAQHDLDVAKAKGGGGSAGGGSAGGGSAGGGSAGGGSAGGP